MANTATKTSSFAVTCSLLSQYMKEKGTRSLTDLGLSSLGKPDSYRPPTTMSLLPGMDVSGNKPADKTDGVSAAMELFPQRASLDLVGPAGVTRKPEKAQLTIFYGGKVLVFDNFPSDKASDLMQLAGKKSGTATANNFGTAPPVVATAAVMDEAKRMTSNQSTTPVSAPNSQPIVKSEPQKAAQVTVSNLPIARKASLHRFLEKRKDRINAKAPYQVKESPSKDSPADSTKADGSRPWLGLKTKPELEA